MTRTQTPDRADRVSLTIGNWIALLAVVVAMVGPGIAAYVDVKVAIAEQRTEQHEMRRQLDAIAAKLD